MPIKCKKFELEPRRGDFRIGVAIYFIVLRRLGLKAHPIQENESLIFGDHTEL